MEDMSSTDHNVECQLIAGLRPINRDERRTRMSQSHERAMLTMG